ncbi:type VI secretion system membrane subunit TssM [Thalassomonas actiniarum]|uniref:Type VI secretion system membrane subunit TssM n=1 Tax=Thalassomonas actiniarum TaxID=485447 RepID=A0AAE9YRL8_9GAMM|nr:type VI secretion system membrane subunit TssM [Thalassomonas actiniarum]WDD99163.1 type VI secretion system membrane subunit TssM [Thalassomonas actiniarum]
MMTFTLTKKHLIGFILGFLFTVFAFAWWFVSSYAWVFALAAGLILVVSLVLWFFNRDEAETKRQKQLEKQDLQLVKKLFSRFTQELKDRGQIRQKYRLPWYLYISHDMAADKALLGQMGFRNSNVVNAADVLPVQIWLKSDAVMLTVQVSSSDSRSLNCLKLLLKEARKFRSRQTLNGIITGQSLETLIANNSSSCLQLAGNTRLAIDEAQVICGQHLPVYCLFNQMSGLADLCQFFASLDEAELDGAFGAMNVDKKYQGHYDGDWFDSAYEDLSRRLGQAVLSALDSQLNENFRRSVVAAPLQFTQLKRDIGFYLEQLFTSKNSPEQYLFRGFFFTNTEQHLSVADPLTKQVAYQLGFNEMLAPEGVKLPHSMFVSRLFNKFIRPEAGVAGVNKRRRRLFWFFQGSYAFMIFALAITLAFLLKANFDYHSELNIQVNKQLLNYKSAIRQTPYDIEDLAVNVTNLRQLRDIYMLYQQDTPVYINEQIPGPGIGDAVKQAYHQALSNILLPSLVRYLEEELFVYETLGESLETAKLLNLNEELRQHDLQNWQHLEMYYQQSFIKEGNNDKDLLQGLVLLMDDLFLLGVPQVELDQALIAQARSSISAINTTEVVFQYIKDLPQFSSLVDISNDLGNNFAQLYEFETSRSGHLVPFIFTPQGFAAMDFTPDSDLMVNVFSSNKALLGHQLTSYEEENISNGLRRYYQRQYVDFWQRFVDDIVLKPVTAENLNHRLSILASKTDAPMNRLYQLIAFYTYPQLPAGQQAEPAKADKAEGAGDKQAKSGEKSASALAGLTGDNGNSVNHKQAMISFIKNEFAAYHQFVRLDDKGISELANLHTVVSDVHKWLSASYASNATLGAYHFQQLTSANKDTSLLHLQQTQVSIEQISEQIDTLVELANTQVAQAVSLYVNQKWQQEVSDNFNQQLAGKFPFALDSDQDASFELVNRFFKPEGVFDHFSTHTLSKFKQVGQQLVLSGYTPNAEIAIDEQVEGQFTAITGIQKTLYSQSDKQLSIPFRVKTKSMSANAIGFDIFSGRTVFNYRHGPKLWDDFVWPDPDNHSELLTIFHTTDNKKQTKKYQGDWAWLRLIYGFYQPRQLSPQMKVVSDDHEITLQLSVSSDINPLNPDFFSQLALPDRLL